MPNEKNISSMFALLNVGNGNRSTPEGDDQKGSNSSESNESKDIGSQNSHHKPLDWREFRAGLYIQEQVPVFIPLRSFEHQINLLTAYYSPYFFGY